MSIVVDASVAAKWFVAEDGHDAALALLRRQAAPSIPDFGLAEIVNVLRRKARLGEIGTAQVDDAVAPLPEVFARVVPTADLIGPAWAIAKALDHSIYDCLYLACAEHTNQPLVTADRRFLDKARAKGRDASIRLLDS